MIDDEVAWHEAGHVVIGLVNNYRLRSAQIGNRATTTWTYIPPNTPAQTRISVAMAGWLAEYRHAGRPQVVPTEQIRDAIASMRHGETYQRNDVTAAHGGESAEIRETGISSTSQIRLRDATGSP